MKTTICMHYSLNLHRDNYAHDLIYTELWRKCIAQRITTYSIRFSWCGRDLVVTRRREACQATKLVNSIYPVSQLVQNSDHQKRSTKMVGHTLMQNVWLHTDLMLKYFVLVYHQHRNSSSQLIQNSNYQEREKTIGNQIRSKTL
jgi:hypothetical protein